MNAKYKTVVLCLVAGIVIGGAAVWGFLTRDEDSTAFDRTTGAPTQPLADQARQSPSTSSDPTGFAQIARAQMERAAAQSHAAESDPRSATSRSVIINGQRISAEQIGMLEGMYRTRVPDGNFWYDRKCGAWGAVGGPTAGFMMAGMNLGGPLQSNASNGNTGVFINGRQLHQLDVLALMRIYPGLQRGRVWMDGIGNWGPENGPIAGNIWAAAAQAGGGSGGQREGILSGYDKTGIKVYGY